jgi:3-oxoacyl-[acyl-carrier protein] reductase
MNSHYVDKKVLITGSSSGLGFEMGKYFSDRGAKVLLNGIDRQKLIDSSEQVANSDFFQCDVSSEEAIEQLCTKIKERYGSIDILICNVGSGKSMLPGEENLGEWRRVFDLNFWSSLNTIYGLADLLMPNRNSSVICISSICGLERIKGAPIAYSVAKAALNAFVQAYAPVLAERGIRINGIIPGNLMFSGSTWEKKILSDPSGVERMLSEEVPLRKFGAAEDIARLAEFLGSDKADFVTGSLWRVDGGQVRGLT